MEEEAPKVKVKYNKELLDACLERDGATLVGEYEKLNRDSVIKFLCKCGEEGDKNFRLIYENSGMFCKKCSKISHIDKIKQSNLEKYGVTCLFQNKEINNRIKNSNFKKYGVENPSQSESIKNKKKLTTLKNYGVEFSFQSAKIREKGKKTNMEKLGVEYPTQSNKIQEKIKQKNLEKLGVEYPSQSADVREKIKQKNLEKLGVEYPSQNPEVFARQQKNSKKFKTYKMPSGATRQVQGYEPFALDALVKHYREDDILTERGSVPRIPYKTSEGKQRYYFPDIYIPHENKIIEVTSTWTYKCKTDNIQEKIQATTIAGYAYELWCFNAKGERVDVAAEPEAEPPRPSRIQRRPASGGAEEEESEEPESEKEEPL